MYKPYVDGLVQYCSCVSNGVTAFLHKPSIRKPIPGIISSPGWTDAWCCRPQVYLMVSPRGALSSFINQHESHLSDTVEVKSSMLHGQLGLIIIPPTMKFRGNILDVPGSSVHSSSRSTWTCNFSVRSSSNAEIITLIPVIKFQKFLLYVSFGSKYWAQCNISVIPH